MVLKGKKGILQGLGKMNKFYPESGKLDILKKSLGGLK